MTMQSDDIGTLIFKSWGRAILIINAQYFRLFKVRIINQYTTIKRRRSICFQCYLF